MFIMPQRYLYLLIHVSLLLGGVVDNYAANRPGADTFAQGKVTLHIDSLTYTQGETIWYSANVLSDKEEGVNTSRVLYVDLLSPEGILLQQQKLPITDSKCHGSFNLAKKVSLYRQDVSMLYPSGSYQLRAYTRQMLNGSTEGNEEDGLMLDGWVVDKGNCPLAGVSVTAVIDSESGTSARKVKVKTDRQGYWCLPMDDFYGSHQVRLSLDGKKNRRNRIVVRQSLCNDLSSQLAEYSTLRTGGIVNDGFVQCFDVLDEENTRLELGLKSVSVADFLIEKGFKTRVDYIDLSYAPNQPPTTRMFYSEPDYGSINSSTIQRLDQTDARKFTSPTPTLVEEGSYVNGHPARWNIKVPKDFPAKIYKREITYTRDVDIKYVKSILLIDYEPTTHPCVTVSVVLRDAEEIGKNGLDHRTVNFAGYSTPTESYAATSPDDSAAGERDNRRTIYWDSEESTDNAGCTTLSFYINSVDSTPSPSVQKE